MNSSCAPTSKSLLLLALFALALGCNPKTPQQVPADDTSAANSGDTDSQPVALIADEEGSEVTTAVEDNQSKLPPEANVTSADEMNQVIAENWKDPQAVLVITGEQHGYIEPCGCTGLENQKGGLIRRDTFLTELRERGWELVPLDCGNQVRRIQRQAIVKFNTTAEALKEMGYEAVTFGIDDLKLPSIDLLQIAGSDGGEGESAGKFISANVTIVDEMFFPKYRVIERGGRKVGVTGILGAEFKGKLQSDDLMYVDPVEALKPVVAELKEKGCDFCVLLSQSSKNEATEIAKAVEGFHVVVFPGYGEPTLRPEEIDGSESVLIQTGAKGMYAGLLGLFDDAENPVRYQRVALSAQFSDSKRMLERFANYQEQLKTEGFDSLGAVMQEHPRKIGFVGSEACGECHTIAFEIWKNSPHVHATESVVAAKNDRGGIARHHDPECVSCHSTGWNVEYHYPFETGFVSPEQTPLLTGSGCENCHGPGKAHVDAEWGDVEVDDDTLDKLRQQMVLTLEEAKESKCRECHDIDNSPDFHPIDENFERFWEKVKHVGKD
ncbi:MAG: multiheme c-type cytochrome [Planctomycetota bacterium]